NRSKNVLGYVNSLIGESAFGLCKRAFQYRNNLIGREHLQNEDLRPREQRGVHLERGVLGGGADQNDRAAFDVVQKCVLLRLVETMNLINENDRAFAQASTILVSF